MNSGESEVWQKFFLYLWSKEAGFQNSPHDGFVTLPDGSRTRMWLNGDMKELDYIATGGGQMCSMPFTRWSLFMNVARLSWYMKIEDSNSTTPEYKRVISGRTHIVAKFKSHAVTAAFFL